MPTPFAERLLHAMKLRDMGFNDLSRAIGKGPGYVSALISDDRDPRLSNVVALARALSVSVDWLATGEGAVDAAEASGRSGEEAARPELVRELVARYPNAIEAASLARRMGVDEDAIGDVLDRVFASKEDFPVATWVDAMREAATKARRDALDPTREEKRQEHAEARIEEQKKSAPKWGKK